MQIPSLGWEDPLEKGMAIHSSILAWRIPWTEESGGKSDRTEQLSNAPVPLCFRKFISASSWRMDEKFQRQETKTVNNQGKAATVHKPDDDHLIKDGDRTES